MQPSSVQELQAGVKDGISIDLIQQKILVGIRRQDQVRGWSWTVES